MHLLQNGQLPAKFFLLALGCLMVFCSGAQAAIGVGEFLQQAKDNVAQAHETATQAMETYDATLAENALNVADSAFAALKTLVDNAADSGDQQLLSDSLDAVLELQDTYLYILGVGTYLARTVTGAEPTETLSGLADRCINQLNRIRTIRSPQPNMPSGEDPINDDEPASPV